MSLFSWWAKRQAPARRRPAARFRPQLESLEDRTVPATFAVNTTLDVLGHDGGLLSLRQAILDAHATPGSDTIVLPAGTYTLAQAGAFEDGGLTGDLDLTGHLTIQGAGAGATVVDAAGLDRVFHVHAGATVTLSGMTIQGGRTQSEGGGIANVGTLAVRDCVLSGNAAGFGGGISNFGGGISNVFGEVTVRDSVLSGNTAEIFGGGVYNNGAKLTVLKSVLSGNAAEFQGGGIYNVMLGELKIMDSTLSGNSAMLSGGGIHTAGLGEVTIWNSALTGNAAGTGGGGIQNLGGTLTVINSTVSGNSATLFGGGIFNTGRLELVGSTLTGNTAPEGADLYNLGTLHLHGSTVGDIFP